MKQPYFENIVRAIDPENAEYIMGDSEITGEFERVLQYLRDGKGRLAVFVLGEAKQKVREFSGRRLTPANIRVGDGVTINLWSDRNAATVIRVTRSTVTVRQDKATINPEFKPEIIPGGFAGHCVNQDEQTYTYKPDAKGREYTFHWSRKYQRYGQPGNLTLSKGRHEFYDYNF